MYCKRGVTASVILISLYCSFYWVILYVGFKVVLISGILITTESLTDWLYKISDCYCNSNKIDVKLLCFYSLDYYKSLPVIN